MEKKNIYQKLLEVKKEMGAIVKDKENPFYKSNYADVNTIIAQLEPLLIKQGLLLTQPLGEGNVTSVITCVDSLEFISSSIHLTELADPQKMGKSITYYRRYTLVSLLGLTTEEDDDGNHGVVKKTVPSKKPTTTPANTDTPAVKKEWLNTGSDRWKEAEAAIKTGGKAKLDSILAKVNISGPNKAKLESLIK